MFAFIPTSNFGVNPNLDQYVYFYSGFGDAEASEAGFEEWATKETGTFTDGTDVTDVTDVTDGTDMDSGPGEDPFGVPEPVTGMMGLMALGVLGTATSGRRRR